MQVRDLRVDVMEDWLGASAAWALLALVPLALAAQQATLHVDVKLVSVFVNVTDRNGAVVGGSSARILP